MNLAKKVGTKLYNFGAKKYNDYKDEQAFRKQEQSAFKAAERKGRLIRAKKEGKKSGLTKPRSRLSQIANAMPTINTNGPDPFGLFQESRPHREHEHKSHKKHRPKKVVYY
jgi:hypothetical protein